MDIPRPLVAITALLLAIPLAAASGAPRVVNGDFEANGDTPLQLPGWRNDGQPAGAARAEGLGPDGSAAALLLGPAVLRSAQLFPVTPGEILELSADVWEARDDRDGRPGVDGDSVIAVEFVDASGRTLRSLSFHCDAYADLLDNDALDGSDECSVVDGYVHMMIRPCPSHCDTPECAKYHEAIVVPAGASRARVLLGGSLASDGAATTPTSMTLFDNVLLS